MATRVFQGNHARGYLGHGVHGTGGQRVPVQMGWADVTGKSGDVVLVQLSALVTGDINQGVKFQSEAGVSIQYTLTNPGIVLDPWATVNTQWSAPQVIPAGPAFVEAAQDVFTVMRVEFTSDGTLHIGVR